MPLIPATLEADIRRIAVQGKTRKKVNEMPISTNGSWLLVAYDCNPSYLGGRDQENHGTRPARANSSQDPISKVTRTK
jgi:hypothetical protein